MDRNRIEFLRKNWTPTKDCTPEMASHTLVLELLDALEQAIRVAENNAQQVVDLLGSSAFIAEAKAGTLTKQNAQLQELLACAEKVIWAQENRYQYKVNGQAFPEEDIGLSMYEHEFEKLKATLGEEK